MDVELKKRIYNGTIDAFTEKGMKFTMDDLAKNLKISKKTIYKYVDTKEQLIIDTIEYGFNEVKISEQQIIENESLDIVEKIKRIIIAMPDRYRTMDWRKMYIFREAYPDIYQIITDRIETGWEKTIELIQQGIKEKKIKKISIPILKTIIESSIEGFIGKNVLRDNNIEYEVALNSMLDVIFEGIVI